MSKPYPNSLDFIDAFPASEAAKEKLKVIVLTAYGELSTEEACVRLGVTADELDELTRQVLQAMLDRLPAND